MLSPSDRWIVKKTYLNIREYAKSLYHGSEKFLGRIFIFSRITYINSYQLNIQMASYEVLYRRKYRSPICWDDAGEQRLLRSKLVQQIVKKI